MNVRKRVSRWLERHRVVGWIAALLYYFWAFALWLGVIEALESLFPWTFLGKEDALRVVSLPPTLLLWVLTNRLIIGRWWP